VQAAKPVEEKVNGSWLQHEVQAGETLYSIFRKFELPGAELSRLIAIEGPDRPLTRLQSGKSVFILVDDSRRIQRVEIRSFGQVSYRYDRQGEGFALKE
jgi:cell envelope opacity-associated protein A